MRDRSRPKTWKNLSRLLSISEEREFERKVLSLLRLFWPALQQSTPRGTWDRKGIDLLTWSDAGNFDCVVQCKGFHVRELGNEQAQQMRKSIESFAISGEKADTYLLVHNRESSGSEFEVQIRRELDRLVEENRVRQALLWDRRELLNHAFERVREILDVRLREHAQELLDHFHGIFQFGASFISVVPITEKELVFARYEPCTVRTIQSHTSRSVPDLILSTNDYRWTLLTGVFGSGKTTAALNVATDARRTTILVEAAQLATGSLKSGTNTLLAEIIRELGLLVEYDPVDVQVLDPIAGSVLNFLLRHQDSPYMLIIDGLDENRVYSNYVGLERLNNQLADFRCPIVLTTRQEHLDEMFGSFSLAFNNFSTKAGSHRSARLLELEHWEIENVIVLVRRVIDQVVADHQVKLREFLHLLENGEYTNLYGELPLNPLFLQFILEDVALNGVRRTDRARLILSWVKQKIRRDRVASPRLSPNDEIDIEDLVSRVILLLENIAYKMFEHTDGKPALAETIDSSDVIAESKSIFSTTSESVLSILLNSVLVSRTQRSGSTMPVAFTFRILQEFFLASFLARNQHLSSDLPLMVNEFILEIVGRSLLPPA